MKGELALGRHFLHLVVPGLLKELLLLGSELLSCHALVWNLLSMTFVPILDARFGANLL